jgi:prenyltransferase beta subunit
MLFWVTAVCWALLGGAVFAQEDRAEEVSAEDVLTGLQEFYAKTAREDGSFQNGIDPDYRGMSDSAFSDLAAVTYAVTIHKTLGWKLPHEEQTIAWLLARQKDNGDFFNLAGTADPTSPQGRVYNTTQALVALHALGVKPKYDPLPVFEEILKQDYKTLPAYSTSFFPLAYLCAGKPIPTQADQAIRALMIQDRDGYLNDHVAATFHASHYYALVGAPTPKARQMVKRILADQRDDGSWFMNLPARDRHATFDAVFTLKHEGQDRTDCQEAIQRAARWAVSCRNKDGGFGHYPGSTSDADANYFQFGTLVMAGFVKTADKMPPEPELLSWGHMIPVRQRPDSAKQIILPHEGWVSGVAFSKKGGTLITACSSGAVTTWKLPSGKLGLIDTNERGVASAVACASDDMGRILSASGGYDHTVQVDVDKRRHRFTGHEGAVLTLAFSPAKSLLASGSIDGRVMLWDLADRKAHRTLKGHKSWVNSVAFTPDGERVVSGSSDGTVKIWNVKSAECERTIDVTKAEVRSVAVSPDGKWIATGIRYGEVKVFDAKTGELFHHSKSAADDVGGVAFMPDSRRLCVGLGEWNRPGRVEIWDIETADKVQELHHTGEVLCVAISRDGKLIAAGGGDNAASIWQMKKE